MKTFIALLAVLALLTGAFAVDDAYAAPKDKEPKEKKEKKEKSEKSEKSEKKEKKEKNDNRDNENRNAGVLICHVSRTLETPMGIVYMGKVIRISEKALDAHLARGDILAGEDAEAGDRCMWTEDAGGESPLG